MGFDVHGVGIADDHAGPGIFLRGTRSPEERPFHFNAVLYYFVCNQHTVGFVWLFSSVPIFTE
jgi:hypothetical protein